MIALLARASRTILIAACLLAAGELGRQASGATLQQLLSGGVLNVGNSQFSDWELVSLDATTAAMPNLAQITVSPLANDPSNPGLQFAGNGQLTVSGTSSIDLTFRFRVHAIPGGKALANHVLELTGVNFGGSGGFALISDELKDDAGGGLDPTLVIADQTSDFTQSLNASAFAPHSGVSVVTNIFINGSSATDAINLTSFTQRFAQTGVAFSAGDFDEDGDVDGTDLARWKTGFGVAGATHVQGDADGDRDVDGADLLIWQRERTGAATARTVTSVTPEPASGSLAMITAFALWLQVPRRRRD